MTRSHVFASPAAELGLLPETLGVSTLSLCPRGRPLISVDFLEDTFMRDESSRDGLEKKSSSGS